MENEGEVAGADVEPQPESIELHADVDVAGVALLDRGRPGLLGVLEGLPHRGELGLRQPRQPAGVLLRAEQLADLLVVELVELVVDRRFGRHVAVDRQLGRRPEQLDLLAFEVLRFAVPTVEVAAVDLEPHVRQRIDADAREARECRLFLVDRRVDDHAALGADEPVEPVAVVLELETRGRTARALVLGVTTPRQAVAVAEPEPIGRHRERSEADPGRILVRRILPVRDRHVRAGVRQRDHVLGQLVDPENERALGLEVALRVAAIHRRVRHRLEAREPRVVVVEEQHPERVRRSEPPARHAWNRLARLGQDVLVRDREREAGVHEPARAGQVTVLVGGRDGLLVDRLLRGVVGGFLGTALRENAGDLAIDNLADLRLVHDRCVGRRARTLLPFAGRARTTGLRERCNRNHHHRRENKSSQVRHEASHCKVTSLAPRG